MAGRAGVTERGQWRRPPAWDRWSWRRRRPGADLVAAGVLLAGLAGLSAGLVPTRDLGVLLHRVGPLLVFLCAVLVLAELAARAEVFDVLAVRMAIVGRGSYPALFALSLALATATTTILSLDTTAALLTPVLLAVGARTGIAALPLAMTTVWLANTASLLLPVANLTNLLAADRIGLPVVRFAARMAAPQAAAFLVTAACLWLLYWRPARREGRSGPAGPPAPAGRSGRYPVPPPYRPRDRVLCAIAGASCVIFAAGILAGLPIAGMAVGVAGVLALVFAVRQRGALRWQLIPWRLLALVVGLFLVVDAADRYGLAAFLGAAIGDDAGAAGVWRAALAGAGSANVINNLPAYLVAEAVVPVAHTDQLLGLLIGVNVGPLVLPWASLATLLWLDRCRAAGLTVSWPRFVWTGAVAASTTLAAAVAALLIT